MGKDGGLLGETWPWQNLSDRCICFYICEPLLNVNAIASILTDMAHPSENTVNIWIQLARAHHAVLSSIEKSLKDAGMPPLSWYDVLLELDRVGCRGARAFVIQEKLLLPQYRLSRLIDRIEKAGYLKRLACDDDRRGQRLVITKSGMAARKDIWLVYSDAIERMIGGKLSAANGKILATFLNSLA